MKELVKTARGRIASNSLIIRHTDIFVESTDAEYIKEALETNLVSISYIWFHRKIAGYHKNPIAIRGFNCEGKEIDFVLCCAPYETYYNIYTAAMAVGNSPLMYLVEEIIMNLFTIRPEPKSERLIIRRFETAPGLGDGNA